MAVNIKLHELQIADYRVKLTPTLKVSLEELETKFKARGLDFVRELNDWIQIWADTTQTLLGKKKDDKAARSSGNGLSIETE